MTEKRDRIKDSKKVFRQINELLSRLSDAEGREKASIIRTLVVINEDLSDHVTTLLQHVIKNNNNVPTEKRNF